MKKNIGLPDRIFRLVIATLLFAYACWQRSWIAGAASLFVFYEALAGWCIYYQLIGKSSCPLSHSSPLTENNGNGQDKIIKLLICLTLCYCVGLSASWFTQESVSTWYQTLEKPWWTPPDIVFPVAWGVLYTMMGLSLWVISLNKSTNKTPAYLAFSTQLFFNFFWSFLFFYLREPFYAFIDIGLLSAAISATIGYFWKLSSVAGILLLPYLLWVVFAATINLYILYQT